jgi:hypothetical protein
MRKADLPLGGRCLLTCRLLQYLAAGGLIKRLHGLPGPQLHFGSPSDLKTAGRPSGRPFPPRFQVTNAPDTCGRDRLAMSVLRPPHATPRARPAARPTRDHIKPRSKGGTLADPANLPIVCDPRNSDKGSRSLASFLFRLRRADDARAPFVAAFAAQLYFPVWSRSRDQAAVVNPHTSRRDEVKRAPAAAHSGLPAASAGW